MKPTRLAQLLAAVALCLAVASSAATGAEDPSDTGSPGLPPGDGTLRGAVVHPDGPEPTAGLRVALTRDYAVTASGDEGIRLDLVNQTGTAAVLSGIEVRQFRLKLVLIPQFGMPWARRLDSPYTGSGVDRKPNCRCWL